MTITYAIYSSGKYIRVFIIHYYRVYMPQRWLPLYVALYTKSEQQVILHVVILCSCITVSEQFS